jgi:predicted phage terminase large subunit-like protein
LPRVSEDFRVKTLANAKMRAAELERIAEFENDLYKFLQAGWKYIDPAEFCGGWHLEAIADHLMAVTRGQIQRLIINVPPRTSKSTLCSVAWPAWTWAQSRTGPLAGPHVQFLTSSYAQSLSMRDSVKMRRLVESPWYQRFWKERFKLTGDQNTKLRFENNKGGYRLSTSVDGTTTGEGGTIILVDDAHNANEMESDVVRTNTITWWDEVMSTRLNDQNTGAYVVIMQRLHQEDLTGHIVSRELDDWTWLMLPMEHDLGRHCVTYLNGEKFWEDPRTGDGELLCPERFNGGIVDNLKRRLGPYGAAGQLNQSPVPRGGGIIQEEWWQHWVNPIDPKESPTYPKLEFLLASLDTAYTEKEENDASALTIWGVFRDENGNPRLILVYGWQDRLTLNDLVIKVIDTCTVDQRQNTTAKRRFPVDRLLIESKASGLSVYQELRRTIGISGKFGIELFNPSKQGDKVARVYSIQHLFSEKMVYVPWVEPYGFTWANEILDQITVFPRGSHDDYVDSMSQALRYLRDMNFALLREEHDMDVAEQMRYSPKLPALYPV